MSRRIVGGGDPIYIFGDNFAVCYDHGAERTAVVRVNVLNGKLNSPRHEGIVHVNLPPCLPDSNKSNHRHAQSYGKVLQRLLGAASISPRCKLAGSNYDLQRFEKLQMPLLGLP